MTGHRTRRDYLRGVAAGVVGTGLLGTGLAGCTSAPVRTGPVELREGFEDGLGAWTTDSHVGPDAGDAFESRVEPTNERARSGQRSLSLFTEGNHDDGTAWVVRAVDVDPDTRYRARGSAYYWSEQESFNVVRHAVVYLGPDRPTVEEDFPPPNANSTTDDTGVGGLREPLDRAAGWNEYAFEWSTEPGSDRLYFALGVSVVWETDRTDFVDDASLVLEPV